MSAGIVLVHGYSGSPENLAPLTSALEASCGRDAVRSVRLPGHGMDRVPAFDKQAFVASVLDAVNDFRKQGRTIIIIGHSTGGVIALAAAAEHGIIPDLFILASAPKKIDAAYLERWSGHRADLPEIPFTSVANMVSLINAVGSRSYVGSFPVLILHGDKDELVPAAQACSWKQNSFSGPVRTVMVPGAGHDLFRGLNSRLAIDVVGRAVADTLCMPSREEQVVIDAIRTVEPEAGRFLARSPSSSRHLASSPSGRTAAGLSPILSSRTLTEPVIANIEITTRCNLKCTYCARSIRGSRGEDMPLDMYRNILGLLPHAYRITLVGLGETLLHPQITEFVAEASSQGRRTALVTNAMLLDEPLARELLKAGLESIAFSIDGATQEISSAVRPGTDLAGVLKNIKAFVELSKTIRPVSTAVFSAVSTRTIASLEQLVAVIAGLGVHVMMLSDLNFRENLEYTLWKNADDLTAARVRKGVAQAFQRDLPALSVRGLEEFGLWKRYAKFLLLPPDRLYCRSALHACCFSPWQTIPVNVRGDVTLCDCQPEVIAGNLPAQPLCEIWNGETFTDHRQRMLSDDPPDACRICPRF